MAHTETNYYPDPTSDEPIVPRRYGNLGNLHGSGDPNGVVNGRAGWTFYDDDSGDFFINTGTGYNSVWTQLSTGGGGGAGLTYYQSGALDPNGVQTGSVGDVFHSRVSSGGDGSTWWKVSGTGTNTGWE